MRAKDTHIKRKVKSGCLTCKARKVKCDEFRPVCNRCRSTGRTCHGYGIWGGGGNDYAERYCAARKPAAPTRAGLYPANTITPEETQHMQWFHCHSIYNITSFFDTTFWTKLVAPATWTEPAVFHAVLALSAAHRNNLRHRQGLGDIQEQFTILQYTKAIHHLQTLLARQDSSSIEVVLVTCLLFTFIEYLRGQSQSAAVHLQTGLRLLRDMHASSARSTHGILLVEPVACKHKVDLAILQGFASLHVQANLFGNHIPDIALILQVTDAEKPSASFASLQEARDSLYKLLHGILIMSQRSTAALNDTGELTSSLIKSRGIALNHLASWRTAYDNTIEVSSNYHPRHQLAYRLLLNYHTMANVMCQCMHSTFETTYYNHTSDFVAIMQHSIELWKYYIPMSDTEQTGPTVDMGWIPPLYYTALKCRVPRIRSHAIRLLRSVPHTEGVWNSTLVANIADEVKQMEEQNLHGSLTFCGAFAMDDIPCLTSKDEDMSLSEADLVQDVQVNLSETGEAVVTFRRSCEISSKILQSDGQKWHDLGSASCTPERGQDFGISNSLSPSDAAQIAWTF